MLRVVGDPKPKSPSTSTDIIFPDVPVLATPNPSDEHGWRHSAWVWPNSLGFMGDLGNKSHAITDRQGTHATNCESHIVEDHPPTDLPLWHPRQSGKAVPAGLPPDWFYLPKNQQKHRRSLVRASHPEQVAQWERTMEPVRAALWCYAFSINTSDRPYN